MNLKDILACEPVKVITDFSNVNLEDLFGSDELGYVSVADKDLAAIFHGHEIRIYFEEYSQDQGRYDIGALFSVSPYRDPLPILAFQTAGSWSSTDHFVIDPERRWNLIGKIKAAQTYGDFNPWDMDREIEASKGLELEIVDNKLNLFNQRDRKVTAAKHAANWMADIADKISVNDTAKFTPELILSAASTITSKHLDWTAERSRLRMPNPPQEHEFHQMWERIFPPPKKD